MRVYILIYLRVRETPKTPDALFSTHRSLLIEAMVWARSQIMHATHNKHSVVALIEIDVALWYTDLELLLPFLLALALASVPLAPHYGRLFHLSPLPSLLPCLPTPSRALKNNSLIASYYQGNFRPHFSSIHAHIMFADRLVMHALIVVWFTVFFNRPSSYSWIHKRKSLPLLTLTGSRFWFSRGSATSLSPEPYMGVPSLVDD